MFICHDILFHVLHYLCDDVICCPLMGVSSIWRQMALDRVKELKITCSNLHEVLLLVAHCPKLTRLEITFTGGESKQSLNSFLKLPSSLAEPCAVQKKLKRFKLNFILYLFFILVFSFSLFYLLLFSYIFFIFFYILLSSFIFFFSFYFY